MVLDGHGHDVWGLAFVALGLVGAFGVYGHSAGPVGTGLAALLGAVFGLSRYLVPPMFAVAAYFLIRGPREPEIDEETGEVLGTSVARRVIGGLVVLLAVNGLLHLIVAPPTISADGLDAYAAAGGFIGGVSGGGLGSLIGSWGAGAVRTWSRFAAWTCAAVARGCGPSWCRAARWSRSCARADA